MTGEDLSALYQQISRESMGVILPWELCRVPRSQLRAIFRVGRKEKEDAVVANMNKIRKSLGKPPLKRLPGGGFVEMPMEEDLMYPDVQDDG